MFYSLTGHRTPVCHALLLGLALSTALIQIASAGSIGSVTPAGASPAVTLTIVGTGFDATNANNTVTFTPVSGSPVTLAAKTTTTIDTTNGTRRVTVAVPAGLPVGPTGVTVTDTATGEVSPGGTFQLVTLTLPNVTSGAPGATGVVVAVQGSPNASFVSGATKVAFGTGITVTSVTVDSPTLLHATLSIAATATLGARNVGVSTSTQTLGVLGAFSVAAAPVNNPPTANPGGPYSGIAGQPVSFVGSGSDPDNDPLSYSWTFGDQSAPVASQSPTHTYTATGTYTAALTVNDGRGGSDTKTVAVSIAAPPNQPPIISSQPITTAHDNAPYKYQLAATDPDGDPLTYSFTQSPAGMTISSGGLIAWTPSPSQLGPQAVAISVSDGRGGVVGQSYQINVTDVTPPVVTLSAPLKVLAGAQVTVTAQATDDVAVSNVLFVVNGGAPAEAATAPYRQQFTVPSAAAAGTLFHVTATARDAAGNASSASAVVAVTTEPDTQLPTVTLNAPAQAAPGATLHLSASASDNVGVSLVTFLSGTTTISTDQDAPYEATLVVPPDAAPGSSIVLVAQAADFSGNTSQDAKTVAIVSAPDTTPPTVQLAPLPPITQGSPITLSATITSHVGVSRVDFVVNGVVVGSTTAPPYETTFDVPPGLPTDAPLQVEAHVVDLFGAETSDTTQAPVSNGNANHAPTANAGGPYAGQTNAAIRLSAGGSSDPDGDLLTYTWDFGDGSAGSGGAPSHVYASAGSFTVLVTVNDGRGGTDTASTVVTVQAAADTIPPVLSLVGPTQALPGSQVTITAQASDNVGVTNVHFTANGAAATDVAVAPFAYAVSVPAVAAPGDTISIHAVASDAAGNATPADAVVTITAQPDTQAPTVAVRTATQAAPGTLLQISAAASDNVGVASVKFLVNGTPVATVTAPPYEVSFQIPAGTSAGALISVVAQAFDYTGNEADATTSVAIVQIATTTPPTVALNAPAQVTAGTVLAFSATAADNVGIASVTFVAAGAVVSKVTAPPYQAQFLVPASAGGTVLRVEAHAINFSGLEASDVADTQVVAVAPLAPGTVTGVVIDDTTTLPLPSATIVLTGKDARGTAYAQTTTSDADGRFVLTANQGTGIVQVSKSGWTRVDRVVAVPAGGANQTVDVRLTPLGASQPFSAVLGGNVAANGLTLGVPPGALQADTTLAVTSVGQQGIESLLPIGWTPVGAVDIGPHGLTLNGGAAVSAPNALKLAPGTSVEVATWDEQAGAWRAVGSTSVGGDGTTLQASIPATGEYAWLLADSLPAAPPMPNAGDLVAGVAAVGIPDSASGAVDPQPKVLFYQPGAHSNVTGKVTATPPLPSGTLGQVILSESYTFISGSAIHATPAARTVVLYQLPSAPSTLASTFVVTPSLSFDPLTFSQGTITVALHATDASTLQAQTIGSGGGSIGTAAGESAQFAPGALATTTPITIEQLTLADTGLTLPAGLEFLDAMFVSFPGTLGAPMTLSIPQPSQVTSSSQVLIARAQEIGGQTQLVLVALGRVSGGQIVSDTALGGTAGAFEGATVPGRYLFLRAIGDMGFASGIVNGVTGTPFAGALVTSGTPGVVALSRATGAYVEAAPTGAVTITAVDVAKSDTGTANGSLVAAGAILPLNVQLNASVPTITAVTPADGTLGVPLTNPIVVTFSKPIDPATVNGINAGNVALAGPGGTAISGSISLSGNNTALTFRPTDALQSNTSYVFTLAQAVADTAGRTLASAFVDHFVTLNTSAPPPPPAGSVTASIPGSNGQTTITATQGTADPHNTVVIVDKTTGVTTPVTVDPNGGFTVTLTASVKDTLQLQITSSGGVQTIVALPPFSQTNADGSVSTVVDSRGGRVSGANGIAVDVPAGAFATPTVVTIKPIAAADFPVQLGTDAQQFFSLRSGIQLDLGGATPNAELKISIPATPDDKPGEQWVVDQVLQVNGQSVLNVTDTAALTSEGRISTQSPPCPGVTGAGVYGFHKATRAVGLNYGLMQSSSYGGLQVQLDAFLGATGLFMPWIALAPPQVSAPVCLPILSGNVTVVPNTLQIAVQPNQLTPADREIVVKDQSAATEFHFPRNIVQYAFTVTGSASDSYQVSVIDPSGTAHPAQATIAGGAPGQVIARLNMDSITVAVAAVRITNATANTVTDFPQAQATVKLSVGGGSSDAFSVTAIDVQGATRALPFTTVASPYGPGNLLARAALGTIDPTRAQIDAKNAQITAANALLPPGTPPTPLIVGAGVCRVTLTDSVGASSTPLDIPLSSVQDGAFSYAFTGGATDTYALEVQYESTPGQCDGNIDSVAIPRVHIQVSNPLTGKVIKALDLPVPPRDEPLNLGRITDDTTPPMVTAGPTRVDSFDPSAYISFTFSEAMDADSLKNNLIVLDTNGNQVKGDVRISDQNRVATFVPLQPLQLAAQYTVTLVGNDSLGTLLIPNHGGGFVQDVSGNGLSTTRLTITTFKPHRLSVFDLGVNLRDVDFVRKRINNRLTTTVVGISNPDLTSQGSPNYFYKLFTIDATDPANPALAGKSTGGTGKFQVMLLPGVTFPVGTAADPGRSPDAVNPCPPGGTTFNGDLAVSTSFNTYYSYLSFFDVSDPASPCLMANKLLTATPDTLSDFSIYGTYHVLGFAKGLATIKTTTGYTAYAAVSQVGLMSADIGKNIPERAPQPATGDSRIKEGLYPGDYVDVRNINDQLFAIDNTNSKLDIFDPALAPLNSLPLPDPPRRMAVAQGFVFDKNGDGIIEPGEVSDLLFVGGSDPGSGRSSIQIVDITDPTQLQIIGSVTLPTGALVRDIDVDGERHRLFLAGSQGVVASGDVLFMIDVSNPQQSGLVDNNGDGIDDRIIWRGQYPDGIWGVKLDADRGLVYVAQTHGLDTWAVYDNCCDLGVDMTAAPPQRQDGGRAALLVKEKQALQQEITAGLRDASTSCGVDVSAISLLEQGSGACLWKGDPNDPGSAAQACDSTYQPGLSDHDYEVYFPASIAAPVQKCTTDTLSARFVDSDTQLPKDVKLPDGSTISFVDVTFFPFSREDFENAKLNLLPPNSSGTDPAGDIGLGRQQLALLWLTGGAYVPLPNLSGYSAGRDLTQILHDLRTRTGIPLLEGYEWATLQTFNFAKSKALLRLKGASDPGSSLHDTYVQQLHDAAKAAIRAAFGRLVADPAGNAIAKTVTRSSRTPGVLPDPGVPIYDVNACVAVDAVSPAYDWPAVPCTSFEQYAASAIARTLQGPNPLAIFTVNEVRQIYQYYLVKADRIPLMDEASADTFIAGISQFLDSARTLTKPIYDLQIATDPDAVQRGLNLQQAQQGTQSKLTTAKITLVPHLFNRGFTAANQVQVAMYRSDAAGSGQQIGPPIRVDLEGGEDQYPEFLRDGSGKLVLDSGNHAQPLFVLGPIDLTTDGGNPHGVSFTIDLPEHLVKEANRNNNVGGFFYYVLNVAGGTPPQTPAAPYVPLPGSDVVAPDAECAQGPALSVSQSIVTADNTTIRSGGALTFGEQVTIQLTVTNLSGDAQSGVTVCSTFTNACYDAGTLAAGQTKTISVAYTVPSEGLYLDGTPTAFSLTAGIVSGAPLRVSATCENFTILPLAPDPNPQPPATPQDTDTRTVMRAGNAVRYFRIISSDTLEPKVGATVAVGVAGPGGNWDLTYTTDSNGYVVGAAPRDPATLGCEFPCMAIPFAQGLPPDTSYTVTFKTVDGMPSTCQAPTTFGVTVTDQQFTRQWTAGAGIQAEATALIGLQGKAGTGLGMSIAERAQQSRQTLTLTRTVNASGGGQIGVAAGPEFSALGVRGNLNASIKGTLSLLLLLSQSHQFKFPANSNDLAAPESTALGALLMASLAQSGLSNPFVDQMLGLLVQQVTNVDSYNSSDSLALGIEASVAGSAGAAAGFGAKQSGTNTSYGFLSFGLEAGLSGTATASAQIGVEERPLTAELVPNFQLKASADLSGALGVGSPSTTFSDEKNRNITKLKDKLAASLKGTISGTWSAKLSLDQANGFTPKSLTLSIATIKGFGWKVGPNGEFIGVGVNGQPDTVTQTYTITDPQVIQKAIDSLQTINQLNALTVVAGVASGGVLLGPAMATSEMINLFDLLGESDATYTVATQRGDGVELPLTIGLGAGAKVKLGANIKLDRAISFTSEAGVIKQGRSYTLQKYTDGLVPALPSDLSDVDEIVQVGLDAASAFGSAAISTVKRVVQSGVNFIKSNLTAQLTFDGDSSGVPEVDLSSFHYTPVAGPVQTRPQHPADSSGPADLPHYGIGGFHQFTPQDQVLGSPATLTVFFEDAEVTGLNKSTLGIYQWDQQKEDWTYLGGTVDPVNNTITTTVNTLGLYTAAPPMPAGTITFTSQAQFNGDQQNPHTVVTFTSGALVMNNGQPVPDGTEFTVASYAPGNDGVTLGTITSQDVDPNTPGIQVVSQGGAIQFVVDIPAAGGAVQAVAFPHGGTALGQQLIQFP